MQLFREIAFGPAPSKYCIGMAWWEEYCGLSRATLFDVRVSDSSHDSWCNRTISSVVTSGI